MILNNTFPSAKNIKNAYGYNRGDLTVKLLSYLGYGDLSFNSNDPYTDANNVISNLAVNLFPLLSYQKIYSDYFRNSQWEKGLCTFLEFGLYQRN